MMTGRGQGEEIRSKKKREERWKEREEKRERKRGGGVYTHTSLTSVWEYFSPNAL